MKNLVTHVATLERIERMKSSVNGNPRYRGFLDNGFYFQTSVDSSFAYSLPNYEGKKVTVVIGTHRGKPTLGDIS